MILSEYTGGGFGSKVTGSITMAIPALLSKKANAPVMMRINQEEEHYIGRVRPAFHGRVKIGFAKNGRITALDLYWLADNGPYEQQHDCGTGARMASLIYQPPAMRFRGMSMVTNTNPTGSQSQPGGMNAVAIIEPVLAKAARQLGIDQVEMRRINAPAGQAPLGPAGPNGRRGTVTSAFVKEALDRGAELFEWEQRKARSRERTGFEGARHRRRDERVHRRLGRIRRAVRHQARRPDRRSIRHRQPRHPLGHRRPSRRRRSARRAVGEVRRHLGQHRQDTCRGRASPAAARRSTR